jgi:hypothetical protein
MTPVIRAPSLMCHSCDEDMILTRAVKDRVWKTMQYEASLATVTAGIAKGSFQYSLDCVIDFKRECLCGHFAAGFVPRLRFDQLFIRFRMKA